MKRRDFLKLVGASTLLPLSAHCGEGSESSNLGREFFERGRDEQLQMIIDAYNADISLKGGEVPIALAHEHYSGVYEEGDDGMDDPNETVEEERFYEKEEQLGFVYSLLSEMNHHGGIASMAWPNHGAGDRKTLIWDKHLGEVFAEIGRELRNPVFNGEEVSVPRFSYLVNGFSSSDTPSMDPRLEHLREAIMDSPEACAGWALDLLHTDKSDGRGFNARSEILGQPWNYDPLEASVQAGLDILDEEGRRKGRPMLFQFQADPRSSDFVDKVIEMVQDSVVRRPYVNFAMFGNIPPEPIRPYVTLIGFPMERGGHQKRSDSVVLGSDSSPKGYLAPWAESATRHLGYTGTGGAIDLAQRENRGLSREDREEIAYSSYVDMLMKLRDSSVHE